MEALKRKILKGILALCIILLFSLFMLKSDYDETAAFLCSAVADNPNIDMLSCPAHQSNYSWLIMLSFGVVLVIMAGTSYLLIPEKTKNYKKIDLSKLDEDERAVIELLKKSDGTVYQGDIKNELGISKVKTTRVLDRLESKEVIERKRRGMTNLVVLK